MTDRCPPVLRRCACVSPAGQLSHCGQVILLVNRRDRHGAYRIIQLAFYDFPGSFHVLFLGPLSMSCHGQWIGLCSVLHPRQHSIGYMGDGFYRSKDPTNSIKVLTVEWNGYRTSQTVTPLQNYTKQRIELSLTVNNDNAYKGQNRVQWVKKAATVWFIAMT